MFKPLMNMARKLTSTSSDHLEYMDYSGDDEVSALVESYNRMVEKLDESMKQVTQAERDKAWSEMARQVAHEIKNPLTPMNLAIQRLIRLKEKNAPNWDEKFKESSRVILEQIAILSDTANEFSTFAKLYSEEPVEIDLDKMLQDQITMFDNRDDVKIMYIGLKDAMISGPRPQLIRVFVNLISNAIQAVEHGSAAYSHPKLGEDMGLVMVCLRNSTKEGFYDIVIEDNGSGVSEENMSKLFTPKFTTKSSGTGLGLAICKNILEKCGGEISYQRSHVLKGACFTVRLPKLN
jgi:nitrogen fixation/metabolism regulation signal transduction histidine kinase